MPIDSSIYFQQKPIDFLGGITRGLQARDQFDQQRQKRLDLEKQNQIDQAYQAGMTTGPDGKVSFDQNKTLSALAGIKGAGKTAYDASNQFQTQDAAAKRAQLEKARQEIEMTGQLLGGVTDQATYAQAMKDAQRLGLPVDGMPPVYDPGLISNLQNRTLTAKDRIEQEWKKQDFGLREQELQSRAADRKEARDERRFQSGLARSEKMQALETPYGRANTADDAKQLKNAHESKASFDAKIKEMIDLRKEYGTEYLNREAVSRGKQLSKDLLLEYKNMAKLGVLSKSDEDIINAIIPDDPLGQDFAPGQDPILSNLQKFKADSDRDFQTRVQTRTRGGEAKPIKGAQNQTQKFKTSDIEWAD